MIQVASKIKPPLWAPGRNSSPLWRGCSGYWPMWEGAGGVARDLSHTRTPGTLVGADWTVSAYGRALSFDGTSSRVDAGQALSFERTDPFSVAAWVYRAGAGESGAIAAKQESSGILRGWSVFFWTNDEIHIILRSSQSSANRLICTSQRKYAAGRWMHVAMTYDGSSKAAGVRLCVDGVQQGLTVVTDALSATMLTAAPLNFGARNNNSLFLRGMIGVETAWRGALAPYDIAALAADPFLMVRPDPWEWAWTAGGEAPPPVVGRVPYSLLLHGANQ